MEPRLFIRAFTALLLVTFSKVEGWTAPDFCHSYDCPEFTVVQKNGDFEERRYVESRWITTKISSTKLSDVTYGFYRMNNYCKRQKAAGYEIPTKTWPALITITEGQDGSETSMSMSWFVPPGTRLPEDNDPEVKLETRPAATVYVRVFGGLPSHKLCQDNVKLLREALIHDGKSFERQKYTGAGYDNPFNIFITHHNEIWISAA